MKEIPLLTANDVECRIKKITNEGAVLLLYKTARVDMRILDEVYGSMNWQRHHEVINDNLFCTISIWDSEKSQWVSKQDVGTESNAEAEKGQASDAFKRAGFAWGIGRELYDAPFIWISGKVSKYDRFHVTDIQYDREKQAFTRLVIFDDKGKERYRLNGTKTDRQQPTDDRRQKGLAAIAELVKKHKAEQPFTDWLKDTMKVESLDGLTVEQLGAVYKGFKKWLES
nr:MAG TPA: Rad52/22 family double-strand break repair protein [Caudoviricetes sp.]